MVTKLGIVANTVLCVVKVVVGLAAGSMALVADGVHSISDTATDVVVLLGVRLGAREPDARHPYGHGRAETFSAIFIALTLVVVGSAMIYYASLEISKGKLAQPGAAVMVVAIISIGAKEWLYRITRMVAIESDSPALYGNAWHHRSDSLSSVAVLIGVVSLRLGFVYGDQFAVIAVGLMIVLVGVRIVGKCIDELAESAVDEKTMAHIRRVINTNSAVRQWHKLRTRMVGREVFLDLHILVDPELKITGAHEIAEKLEDALHEQIPRPVNITVHIEPDLPALRK